jgi:hypothetical protein
MQTIAKILNIKYQNGISRKKYDKSLFCNGFEEMQEYHGTTIKRSKEFLKLWIMRKDVIYKEHLLPTKDHIEYIKEIDKPIVILLRDVNHVIDNYQRSVEKYKSGKMGAREQKGLIIKKLCKLDYKKLKEEYKEFNGKWLSSDLGSRALYITFNDLILRYFETMRNILDHYGYPNAKIIPLMKAKGNRGDYNTYTGIGEKRLKNRQADR